MKSILEIKQNLHKGLDFNDLKSYLALDQLHSQLPTIESRFTKGLEANTPPNSKKTGLPKSTTCGIANLGFLIFGIPPIS